MSKMGALVLEMQEAIANEVLSFEQIARMFDVPVSWVLEAAKMMDDYEQYCQEAVDDTMDGDHATALASAGFGTDEDYGGSINDSWYEDQYDLGDF